VVIEYPAAGEYTVDIDARFLFFAAVPQPYSIAVSGWPAGAGGRWRGTGLPCVAGQRGL